MAAAAPPQPRAEMPAPSRGADLEAAATGRPPPPQKRQLQATDREYEKCACCRRKHLKCLPTNRDWSKGEKCLDCSKRNCPCGPNEKAPKIRKTLAVGGEVQFGLAPSPSSLSHTPTRPIRASSLVSEGGVGLPFSCTPSQASLDSAIEEETSIYSCVRQLGRLLSTLGHVDQTSQSIDCNLPNRFPNSSTSIKENALDSIVVLLQREFSNVLKSLLTLCGSSDDSNVSEALWIALDYSKRVAKILKLPAMVDKNSTNGIRYLQSAILERLISISTRRQDDHQVERLRDKMRKIHGHPSIASPGSTTSQAESRRRTSRDMRDVLLSLDIPPKHSNALQISETDPFPAIQRAVLDRNEDVVQYLCQTVEGALEDEDILKRSFLHTVAKGSVTQVLTLLEPDSDQTKTLLKKRDLFLKTPLCIAAEYGNYEVFVELARLTTRPDLEARDEDSQSVLTIACRRGHIDIVKYLLEQNISPNVDDFDYRTPLHAAAENGHMEVCRLLLDNDAWVDWYSRKGSAEHAAFSNGHVDIVDMINDYKGRRENYYDAGTFDAFGIRREILNDTGVTTSPDPLPSLPHTMQPPSTPRRPPTGMLSPPPTQGHSNTINPAVFSNVSTPYDPTFEHLGYP